MGDQLKRICTGTAYLYTPDGGGLLMADHYHPDAGCVTNEPELDAVVKFEDDFSSGTHPGFNMPMPKIVSTKIHAKTTIKAPTMAISGWHVNDYYTKGVFPPKNNDLGGVPEVEGVQLEEVEWEWANPVENGERCTVRCISEAKSGISDQQVGRFSNKEWEEMAGLLD